MKLSEMQHDVKIFSEEKGFSKSSIEQRTLFLVTEIGEVVRELLHVSYHPDAENIHEVKQRIGLEMYDVIWNLCDLANKLDIDLEEASQRKIDINKTRTWG